MNERAAREMLSERASAVEAAYHAYVADLAERPNDLSWDAFKAGACWGEEQAAASFAALRARLAESEAREQEAIEMLDEIVGYGLEQTPAHGHARVAALNMVAAFYKRQEAAAQPATAEPARVWARAGRVRVADQKRECLVPYADPRWERERNHAANDFLQQYAADIVTVRLSPLDAFKIGYEVGFLRAAALAPELTDACQERDAAAFAAWWARFVEAYPLAKAEPKIEAAATLAWQAALQWAKECADA